MAIFNFVKQAGQMMSEGLEKAADAAAGAADATSAVISEAAIRAKIQASSLKPKDLSLKKIDDDTVKVYAVVGSAQEREELILMIGNTPGVAKVEDAVKVRPEGSTADVTVAAPKFYTVKAGDSLSVIAQAELGDGGRYMEIFNANRNILSDPDVIEVGQTLRIPQ